MVNTTRDLVTVAPVGGIITIDGALGDVFAYLSLAANASVVVKNVAPGKTVKFIVSTGPGGPHVLSEEGGASKVQDLRFMGGQTEFGPAGASETAMYDIVGVSATVAYVSCGASLTKPPA